MKNLILLSSHGNSRFNPELIESTFRIYSPVTKAFHKPEWWGNFADEKGHVGSLSFMLDFEIQNNETRFFSGNGISVGCLLECPDSLIMIGQINYDTKKYVKIKDYYPEKTYSRDPKTNYDFIKMVELFIEFLHNDFQEMQIDYYLEFIEKNGDNNISDGKDDLPF